MIAPTNRAHNYATNGEVKTTKQEIIAGGHRAVFEPVKRDTIYNCVKRIGRKILLGPH